MRLLALLLCVAVAAVAAIATPAASANGDPPSNVLINQDVYTPAEPAAPALVRDLKDAVLRAKRAGYPTKVVVVHTELDLGNVPQALGKPQQYADYLLADLHGPSAVKGDFGLLVVTPAGAGIAGKTFNTDERKAARTINVSTSASSSQLVRAATTTLEKLAAAAGDPIGGAGAGSGGGGSNGVVIAGVLAGLLALTVVAVLGARARRRGESPPADG